MGIRTNGSVSLESLIRMAVPLLKRAEKAHPRTGPGAKPEIPDWFMGVLIMVAVSKRKKSKSAQFRFINVSEHRKLLTTITGEKRFPARSTYFDRYRRAHDLFQMAIALQGQKAINEGVTDARHTAVDKSLVASLGPPWHSSDRKRGKVPRGVDIDSAWGYSEHHGWVQGYSFEVLVTSTPKSTVLPLLASADVASAAETKSCAKKLTELPLEVETVSGDSAYDANQLAESVEYNEHDRRTKRRFLCPENPRNSGRKKTKKGAADQARAKSRQRRETRKRYFESKRGRQIYKRRSKTVEPFNSWFKSLFDLQKQTWHRGLANNQTLLLAGIFVYQLLVRYNHRKGLKNGKLKYILDAL